MNRSKLFFGALLLGSAMAGPILASQAPKPENKSTPKVPAGKNVTSGTPHTITAAKCGRCDAGGKKTTMPVTAEKKGPAIDKKGDDARGKTGDRRRSAPANRSRECRGKPGRPGPAGSRIERAGADAERPYRPCIRGG